MTFTEEKITFEQMPQLLAELGSEINGIKGMLNALTENANPPSDKWMDLDAFRKYHSDKPDRSTVYEWVNLKKVPVHKDGKRLRFLKSEIDEWLSKGRRMTLFGHPLAISDFPTRSLQHCYIISSEAPSSGRRNRCRLFR